MPTEDLAAAVGDYAAAVREHLDAKAAVVRSPGDRDLIEACGATQWRLDECTRMLHWHALRAAGWSAEQCDRYLYRPSGDDG